jgi:hypothetical protein
VRVPEDERNMAGKRALSRALFSAGEVAPAKPRAGEGTIKNHFEPSKNLK